ncbi:MAG: hypothetical protein RLZZ379_610, partial [Pseudomonadota bacterium]
MPQIIILPHVELCPEGAALEAATAFSTGFGTGVTDTLDIAAGF